ncbi:MAG: acylphosphatase [Pseudomonadota bacterium]|nr:acylphosphatase [Pseudomonadota bacterium]
MRVGRSVRISGRVQGVFYRGWTKNQAERLSVVGWVRNCSDGSVEAHLEGNAEAVERMIDAMRHGPSGAKVERIEVEAIEVEKTERFKVRRCA